MKGKFLMVAALALFLSFVFFITGLQAADSISTYMGFSREVGESFAKRIQEKTGIEIRGITLSQGEIAVRMETEYPRFSSDMFLGFDTTMAVKGNQKGYFESYRSPAWEDIDSIFKSPNHTYYSVGVYSFLLLGNKKKLAEKGWGMPMSWKELLDPKWKGQIVCPSPRTSGTAFMINYSFLQLYGEKEGWSFLEALDENMAFYTKSGNAPTDLVSRGEYLLGLSSDENVLKRINDGYPLVWVIPVEGIGYESPYYAIAKGTKKIDLCKKVMDYLGTEDAARFVALTGTTPSRSGIPSALYGAAKPKYIKLDHAWAVENKKKIVKTWKRKFIMKETSKAKKVGDEKEKKAAEKAKKQ
jgi:iron(III) transport system substrate-binding protein